MLMIAPIAKAESHYSDISDLIFNENPIKGKKSKENKDDAEEAVKAAKEKLSGMVSWYSDKFHGRKTSSGELYDKNELTAAHPSLPFGTKVKVTNKKNGKSVVVKINDRGPHTKSRVLDLSKSAFNEIGSIDSGVLNIDMEVIK